MQSLRYNDFTAPRQAAPYRAIKSWMQPSLLMQDNKVSTSTIEGQTRPDFATIDDAIQKAEALVSDLKKLGERKYPLDVRKASQNTNRNESGKEVKRMVGGYKSNRDSIQVRDGK